LAAENNSLALGKSGASSTDLPSQAIATPTGTKQSGLLSAPSPSQPSNLLSPRSHGGKETGALPRSRLGSVANIEGVQVDGQDAEQMAPIETTQQFLDWFSGIEGKMERDQEDVYRYVFCNKIPT
jgi:hypothetical protein